MKESILSRRSNIISVFVSLIFLTHPIQTQAVTYILQRGPSLAGCLYLLSMCFYFKYRLLQINKSMIVHINIFYILCWISAILAMFTKEHTVTLPFMFILCEFYFFKDTLKKWHKEPLYFFALLVITPIALFIGKPSIFPSVQAFAYKPSEVIYYLLTQPRVLVTYMRLLLLPINQNVDYYYPLIKNVLDLRFIGSVFILAIVVIIAARLYYRHRFFSFSIFWFFLVMIPESSIMPLADVIFEYRLYLAMTGFSFLLVGALCSLRPKKISSVILLLVLITGCYAALTYERNKVWKNEFTLWDDSVRKSPLKARPYNNRGVAYAQTGDMDKAIADFTKAIALDPNITTAYYSRGVSYTRKGDMDKAIADFNKAIGLDPNLATAYNSRGVVYAKLGNKGQAIADFNKAIGLDPNLAAAYYNRGLASTGSGNLSQAVSDFDKANSLEPQLQEVFNSN